MLFLSLVAAVQLLSLLLEALSCPDQGVQLSTLSCLHPVLADPLPALIQQLEALVSRLLALTASPAMVSETPCVQKDETAPFYYLAVIPKKRYIFNVSFLFAHRT